jgi:hypothetical protein
MGEGKSDALRVEFDPRLRLEFHGASVTSDAGLLAHRNLDEVLKLTAMVEPLLADPRTGDNRRQAMTALRIKNAVAQARVAPCVAQGSDEKAEGPSQVAVPQRVKKIS